MVSLKQRMNEIDVQEKKFHAAFDCFLATLLSIADQAPEITPELTGGLRNSIRNLYRTVSQDRTEGSLKSGYTRLVVILEDHRERFGCHQSEQEQNLRSLIGSLGSVAQSMSAHKDSQSDRWAAFTAQLQQTACLTDLGRIKSELNLRVQELQVANKAVLEENQIVMSDLESRLGEMRIRLAEVERQAATDALTGLLNRGAGESLLRKGLADGTVSGMLMIDLNGFKQINDRWGHDCGDQILQMFSRKLAQVLGGQGSIIRWGGDEFLVALHRSLNPDHRPESLEIALRDRYGVVFQGRTIQVEMSASVGAAEAGSNRDIKTLLSRADGNMYKQKQGNRRSLSLRTQ